MAKQPTTSPRKRTGPTTSHAAPDPASRARSQSRSRAHSRTRAPSAGPTGAGKKRNTSRARSRSASPRRKPAPIEADGDAPPIPPLRSAASVQTLARARSPAKQPGDKKIGVTKRGASPAKVAKGAAGAASRAASAGVRKSSRLIEKAASSGQGNGQAGGKTIVGRVHDTIVNWFGPGPA